MASTLQTAKLQHVVICQESYVAGTRERPEVGIFTQTHSSRPPVPWGALASMGQRCPSDVSRGADLGEQPQRLGQALVDGGREQQAGQQGGVHGGRVAWKGTSVSR